MALALLMSVTRAGTYEECLSFDTTELIGDKVGEFVQNYDEILEFSTGYMRAFAFSACFNDERRLIAMNFTIKEQASDKSELLSPLGPIEKGDCSRKRIGDFENLIDRIDVWYAEGKGIYSVRFWVGELGETFGEYPAEMEDEILKKTLTYTDDDYLAGVMGYESLNKINAVGFISLNTTCVVRIDEAISLNE